MRLDGWLVLVMVRLGMAAAAPRTADGALPEAVQRTLTGMEEAPYQLDSGHKIHRPHHSHRVRHRSRGTLAPEGKISWPGVGDTRSARRFMTTNKPPCFSLTCFSSQR